MPRFRSVCAFMILIYAFAAGAFAQTEKIYPSDEEIRLLLTQTDRALQRYKPLLDEQENEIGKSVADDGASDRQVVSALEASLKQISTKRGFFNGTPGFEFLQHLANADRSVLRCGFAAASQSTGYTIAGNHEKADALLHLSQTCMDLSTLFYTIRESANSLYRRFIVAQDQWGAHSTQEARQCSEALEKSKTRKFESAY